MTPKTIVVPLDGSQLAERAARVATPLARQLGADVVFVATPWEADPRAPRAYLDSFTAPLGDEHIDSVVVDDRDAADAILGVARDRPRSIICMTTHGRGRLRWAVAGSVAEEVIRASTDPLLLVGPRGDSRWSAPARRVVVCVDGSPTSRTAVEHACDWAKALDLEVALVFVAHPLDVEDTEHPEEVFGPLEEIVRARGIDLSTRQLFRSSFVAGALVDEAEEPAATMMVMAAHRHSGLARIALGSVTMAVLNTAPCPVLVVPPDGSG